MGGKPLSEGDEPEGHSHGDAKDAFASVVFDEDFVRAATIHEPSAVERMLAAAQARAETEAARRRGRRRSEDEPYEEGYGDFGHDPDDDSDLDGGFGRDEDGEFGPYGRYGSPGRRYGGHGRWHRAVAWLLAVLMGVGVVALAFAAVYRSASGSRQDPSPPPATSGVDTTPPGRPGALPSLPAVSRTPAALAP